MRTGSCVVRMKVPHGYRASYRDLRAFEQRSSRLKFVAITDTVDSSCRDCLLVYSFLWPSTDFPDPESGFVAYLTILIRSQ